MKIAMVQMASSKSLEANLSKMHLFFDQAVSEKADCVVFPEMAYLTGSSEVWQPEIKRYSEIVSQFQVWAKKAGVILVPGSLREPIPGEPGRYWNTLPVIGKKGDVLGAYRKIFLFRADLPGKVYEEGKFAGSGKETLVLELDGWKLGFSICFDLRFPEIFRSLKKKGAQIILMPSAFTVPTGKAHWEVLVRARAIENQSFLIAPNLVGTTGEGSGTYGHSLAVGPWGEILQDMQDTEAVSYIDCELVSLQKAQKQVDAWGCRREDIFPIR